MKVSYYPGCTLKTKAKNLDLPALKAMAVLGVEMEELPRWNCCGAVYSLADDDLIHQIAPVRDLVRAKESGAEQLITLCAMCYNTLARANQLMTNDEEKRQTINTFMEEEIDYTGEVKVYHLLEFLKTQVGWEKLTEAVKKPLNGLRVAPYYGCTLLRPKDISIDQRVDSPTIFQEFIQALGGEVVTYSESTSCCSSFQILSNKEAALKGIGTIISSANQSGAEVIISSCPLCEYNLGRKQTDALQADQSLTEIPTLYFSQILALALGIDGDDINLEMNIPASKALLEQKGLL